MRSNKLLSIGSSTLLGITVLGIGSVSHMAFQDPQAVMDLVGVKLPNTDAYSSIRGVYGGVGISILGVLLYLAFTDRNAAVGFMALFWGMYAVSRLTTIGMEGALGAFGSPWLVIEGVLSVAALALLVGHGRPLAVRSTKARVREGPPGRGAFPASGNEARVQRPDLEPFAFLVGLPR